MELQAFPALLPSRLGLLEYLFQGGPDVQRCGDGLVRQQRANYIVVLACVQPDMQDMSCGVALDHHQLLMRGNASWLCSSASVNLRGVINQAVE